MSFNQSDVILLLSGGNGNVYSSQSIGGAYSNSQVNLNLFDNINYSEITSGFTNYRCIYLYNGSPDYFLDNIQISVEKNLFTTDIQLGVLTQSDIQKIIISGPISGGNFVISYYGNSITVNYNSNPSIWRSNFQSALDGVIGTGNTIVSYSDAVNVMNFTITFSGAESNTFQNIFSLISNGLIGSPTISIKKIQDGSPINSTAFSLPNDTSVPPDIVFNQYYNSSLILDPVYPGDFVPLWIMRYLPPNSESTYGDGFSLLVKFTPVLT